MAIFIIYDKSRMEIVYKDIVTNHSITMDEVLDLAAPETWKEEVNDHCYFTDILDYYYDDLELTANPPTELLLRLSGMCDADVKSWMKHEDRVLVYDGWDDLVKCWHDCDLDGEPVESDYESVECCGRTFYLDFVL